MFFFFCLCLVALNAGRAVEAAPWGWGRQPACVISGHLAAQNHVFKDAAAALVCCAGPCDGCPATTPSGSASGSAGSTPVRVSAASPSTASFHQASRRHHLVPVSWNRNPSEVLVVLQLLEDTSNNFLVSSALSVICFSFLSHSMLVILKII